ncbi:hypothetical protein IAQ61_004619 [Plenodomus lingam]|uniref:Cell surface protein n=1 Tax=Leptosphaeria maculans (strain JN3 / isolate v23.1.3 / race Av1-4-5-6-7-8) TaxID=985895 RepID=E4ZW09_LEPMJ|nr:hypothetical protein LEMA_P029370.1 [Plenodomus lingam JN3]KAH9873992.1 hypothetical protein IAQ61_004619 [Plenodomus lingam]CBX95785.1 hypothetical protein LEMA_P029370.1 [Plenodomus lingam JN3]
MSILVPLYIYPSPGAWDPLYSAAKSHWDVEFTVILNPCSGPCMGSLPDQVYLDEIPKLQSYPNIRTLGYVATHYLDKEIETVFAEIDTYAKWPTVSNISKMRVDGIFFDETPSSFDPQGYEYLQRAQSAVRNQTTFKDHFVAHNPGILSPGILNSKNILQQSYLNLTDLTVVFEETFEKWLDKETLDPLQAHKIRRSKLAVILHSMPHLSDHFLDFVVDQVEETGDWLFLTNVQEVHEYYHSFSPMFANMVKAVDTGLGKRRRDR